MVDARQFEQACPHPEPPDGFGDDEETEEQMGFSPDERGDNRSLSKEQFLRSSLLLSSLELASASSPRAHYALAMIHRCAKPNSYLYDEALNGHVLNAVERGWVEDFQRLGPQHGKYESHLRAAALGGIRAAALEYGTVFESSEFVALAGRLAGNIDAERMAKAVTAPEDRARWLRVAAEEGSRSALEQFAAQGDAWAEDQVAAWADTDWLRRAAERAITKGESLRAWTWHYLSLSRGVDLTRSTMAAYHDGGSQDGQFYDSDFGGALYVDGNEAIELPPLDGKGRDMARRKAQGIAAGEGQLKSAP